MTSSSASSAASGLRTRRCYHTVELPDGSATPGEVVAIDLDHERDLGRFVLRGQDVEVPHVVHHAHR